MTVTLDESEDYLLGNDSDTVFIRDNDTRRIVWTGGAENGLWEDEDNWVIMGISTHVEPEDTDDVYFNASGTGDCTNAGSGLSTLYGMHITGTYDGTVTLGNELSVGTFEQTIGSLELPDDDYDLSITHALLWSGGILGTTDEGAEVNVDGAAGRLDPPNTGSMSIGSTFRIINSALVTILPGTLKLIGGGGLYIAADMKIRPDNNTEATIDKENGNDKLIDIASGGKLTLFKPDVSKYGKVTLLVPLQNAGTLTILPGIHVFVNGRVGGTGPSISQTGGLTSWASGSNITTDFGMSVTGGDVSILLVAQNSKVILVGAFTFNSASGSLMFSDLLGTGKYGQLLVEGNVTWTSGTYKPRLAWDTPRVNDRWVATGTFTIAAGGNAKVEPNTPTGNIQQGNSWDVLFAFTEFQGAAPTLPSGMTANYETVLIPANPKGEMGYIRKK